MSDIDKFSFLDQYKEGIFIKTESVAKISEQQLEAYYEKDGILLKKLTVHMRRPRKMLTSSKALLLAYMYRLMLEKTDYLSFNELFVEEQLPSYNVIKTYNRVGTGYFNFCYELNNFFKTAHIERLWTPAIFYEVYIFLQEAAVKRQKLTFSYSGDL
jgi:hypothetical protein